MPVLPYGSHKAIIDAANSDSELQSLIADPDKEIELADAIREVVAQANLKIDHDTTSHSIHRASLCILINKEIEGETSRSLNTALSNRRKAQYSYRNGRRNFLASEKITREWKNKAGDFILNDIPSYSLPKLKKAFPPRGVWPCDSEDILDIWDEHIRFGKQHDKRLKRRPPMVIDEDALELVIPADKSCVIIDSKTKEIVLIVLRNFVATKSVREWMSEVITVATDTRKTIRVSVCNSCH